MNILALDLSTRSTGYAIKSDKELIEYGCITQPSSKNFIERLYIITDKIIEIIKKYDIKKIYCEEVRFGDTNVHTFKTLMYLQSHLVCETYMYDKAIEFIFLQPSEHRAKVGIKTGRGITREQCKAAAIKYVKDKYDIDVNDDIADAISIADAASLVEVSKPVKLKPIGSDESAF